VTELTDWHATNATEVVRQFETGERGLSTSDAARLLETHGPNELEDDPPPHPLVLVLRQFKSPLIYILLAATIITLLLEEYLDAAVIAAVLALNAVIGFTQERKAEGAVRALMGLVVPHARVIRNGQEWEIDSRELVPGDMVLLEPGARVPADLRLTHTNNLHIDESLLTGESAPVKKHADVLEAAASLADRRNMAFTGAVVTSGRGRGVAVATGTATELGAIAGLIRSEVSMDTPLQQRMARFASVIGVVVGVASVLVFASGVALGGGVSEMFLTAVALAVAAIPEGLPVVFTITLALGVRRMAQRNAIIRRLPAVETLGSTTVIGSDKTGTLTENRMTVRTIWSAGHWHQLISSDPMSGFELDRRSNEDAEPVGKSSDSSLLATLRAGALANEAEVVRSAEGVHSTGDPTEVALLVAAMGAGIEPELLHQDTPVIAEIPFESENRYAAVFCRSAAEGERPDGDGGIDVYVKGAPERVIEMCDRMVWGDEVVAIDSERARDAAHEMASSGLRVLAMATDRIDSASLKDHAQPAEPDGLVLLGFQGMWDPPREGVKSAIATCYRAGIKVIMITGDHAVTATAIARDLGLGHLAGDREDAATPGSTGEPRVIGVVTGADLAVMSDEELSERVADTEVFARVAPEEKLRIVRSLQARGDVVAVTGDGVNDAPALKAAEIGVAMGRGGTDVAREAADMVLTDDNFVSIAAAVEEGRVTFDNVRKVTFFLVSTGAATIVAIIASVWLGWPLLMLPAQLLWLNLVTNGLQDVALAFEPGESNVLDRKPRRLAEGVLSRELWQRTVVAGVVMAVGTLILFRWQLDRSGPDTAQGLTLAQTTALTVMVIFMALHAGNSRSEHQSIFKVSPISNPFLLAATVAAVGVHIGALYFGPTQFVLRVEPLDLDTWMRIVALSVTILIAMEIDKALRRRHRH
jgi:magnesium-transporting ATPase (P-type)